MAEQFYDAPVTMYLREHDGYVQKHRVIGETSRSWLIGYKHNPFKYSKRECAAVTELEYEREQWAYKHRDVIMDKVRYGHIPFDVLVKIADAVGYTEPRPGETPKTGSEAA